MQGGEKGSRVVNLGIALEDGKKFGGKESRKTRIDCYYFVSILWGEGWERATCPSLNREKGERGGGFVTF